MSIKQLFNDGWEFAKQRLTTELETINGNDITWSFVDIPHDWLIYNTKDLYETGEGWYKKKFNHKTIEGQVFIEMYG
ncbi:MAG: hypothetical protein GX962_02955 [Epulopiscium sp.]|nr:hypothetical protein [Candidatus Epulonipiscium sp.]